MFPMLGVLVPALPVSPCPPGRICGPEALVTSGAVPVYTVASERAVFYRAAYCMNPGRLLSTVTAHERLRHTGAVSLVEG